MLVKQEISRNGRASISCLMCQHLPWPVVQFPGQESSGRSVEQELARSASPSMARECFQSKQAFAHSTPKKNCCASGHWGAASLLHGLRHSHKCSRPACSSLCATPEELIAGKEVIMCEGQLRPRKPLSRASPAAHTKTTTRRRPFQVFVGGAALAGSTVYRTTPSPS